MPKDLLVVLPPTVRRRGDWIVVDIPCYIAGQDQRDEKAPEGSHDREGRGGHKGQPLTATLASKARIRETKDLSHPGPGHGGLSL